MTKPNGELMMQAMPDGQVMAGGAPAPFKLEPGGASLFGPTGGRAEVRFKDDGSMTMEPKDGAQAKPGTEPPRFKAEGCTGEMARTCGMAFFAYMILSSGQGSSAPPPAGAAAGAVPAGTPTPPGGGAADGGGASGSLKPAPAEAPAAGE